jgi:hypothetical protein
MSVAQTVYNVEKEEDKLMMKLKQFVRKRSWPTARYCSGILTERLRRARKTLRKVSVPAEYKSEALPPQTTCSIFYL